MVEKKEVSKAKKLSEKKQISILDVEKNKHPVLASPRTFGQRAADNLAKWAGSWTFILGFFVFLFVWMALNTVWLILGVWDLYPFILLNLVLSCVAAIQAPIILMAQNRAAQKDRQKVPVSRQRKDAR